MTISGRIRSAHFALPVVCAAGMLLQPTSGKAQAACTYERCALRVHQTFWSIKVVQGSSDSTVGSMGWFAPRINVLASSTDSIVRQLHNGYRSAANRGGGLAIAGTAAFIGSLLALSASNGQDPAASAILLGIGFGLSFAGTAERARGIDRLHQAIWRYNGQYAR